LASEEAVSAAFQKAMKAEIDALTLTYQESLIDALRRYVEDLEHQLDLREKTRPASVPYQLVLACRAMVKKYRAGNIAIAFEVGEIEKTLEMCG
jgi:hypothetical protein